MGMSEKGGSGPAAFEREVGSTGVSTGCYGCVDISHLPEEARKKRSPVLFHFVGQVAPYRIFVALHLINKAGTKPFQVAIG